MRIVELPTPPTQNHAYREFVIPAKGGRPARVMRALSDDGQAYVAEVRRILRAVGWQPVHGPMGWRMVWRRERRAGDLTNRYKILEDALNGYAWADDAQVVEHGPNRRVDDKTNPGVTLYVWEITADRQEALELHHFDVNGLPIKVDPSMPPGMVMLTSPPPAATPAPGSATSAVAGFADDLPAFPTGE